MKLGGTFHLTCRNPDGSIAWEAAVPNLVLNGGIDHMLGVELAAATQVTTWKLGLIDAEDFDEVAAADTASSHAGWTELTSYDEAARPTWTPGTVASQSVSNASSPADFTMNAAGQIQGAFLISNGTKGGTTGTLFSAGVSSDAPLNVASGQVVSITYPFNGGGG